MTPLFGDRVVGFLLLAVSLWWMVRGWRRASRTVDRILADADSRGRHPSSHPAAATAPTEPATGAGWGS